jgi:hypothetical protein
LQVRRLAYVDRAWIPESKLKDYALGPDHVRGRHKARLFASMLGIERDDWRFLHDQILGKLPACEASWARPAPPYGVEYTIFVPITGRNGASHLVQTAWILDAERRPRFTTAYPVA